jgi:PilZ domain
MVKDKRKSVRQPIRYTAWVALEPDQLHGCVLSDISETGARIEIDETKPMPDEFVLMLSSNGTAQRKCRVVWRKPRQLGVIFERSLDNSEQATLVPKLDADTDSATPQTATNDAESAKGA